MNRLRFPLLVLSLVFVMAQSGVAQEWTRFRGPNGTGISMASGLPVSWTMSDFDWRVEIPGISHSQPVLWGEKIFLTSAKQGGLLRMVLCLDAKDGHLIWKKEYRSTTHRINKFNSYASSTPAVDSDSVFVVFDTTEHYQIQALDHSGNEQWKVDLGPVVSQHGLGTSPIIFEDMVVLANEQDEGGTSFLIALDRKTGKERWKTPRRSVRVAYSTPCVHYPEGKTPRLIFNSQGHGTSAVEARTGKPIWEAPLLDKRSCSSPILISGLFTMSCGSGAGGNYLATVRPGGEGDVSETHFGYRLDGSSTMPYVPTPITNSDLLFLVSDKGIATCVDGPTGKILWQKRIGANFFASPVRVQDRIYCIATDGECIVLAASKDFEILARNPLGEAVHATPAIANGRIYLRTFHHLISIGGKKGTLVGSSSN